MDGKAFRISFYADVFRFILLTNRVEVMPDEAQFPLELTQFPMNNNGSGLFVLEFGRTILKVSNLPVTNKHWKRISVV